MRELKFRLWNTVHKRMNYDGGMAIKGNRLLQDDHNILMQFTGIEDCNFQEIYDRDILMRTNGDKFIVFWDNEKLCWMVNAIRTGSEMMLDLYNGDNLSVIGNEFESKKFVKSEDKSGSKN